MSKTDSPLPFMEGERKWVREFVGFILSRVPDGMGFRFCVEYPNGSFDRSRIRSIVMGRRNHSNDRAMSFVIDKGKVEVRIIDPEDPAHTKWTLLDSLTWVGSVRSSKERVAEDIGKVFPVDRWRDGDGSMRWVFTDDEYQNLWEDYENGLLAPGDPQWEVFEDVTRYSGNNHNGVLWESECDDGVDRNGNDIKGFFNMTAKGIRDIQSVQVV